MKRLKALLAQLEAARKQQNDLAIIKSGLQLGLGFILAVCAGALFVLAVYAYCPKLHYLNAYLPKDDVPFKFDPKQARTLNELVSKGLVISASDLYNDTLSFYSTLISWLIGILGISGIVAFIYIRGKSKEEAEEQATKAVDQYFGRLDTHNMLAEKVELEVDVQVEPIRKSLENLEDIALLKTAVKKLEEKVELLTANIPKTLPAQPEVTGPKVTAKVEALVPAPQSTAKPEAPAPAPKPAAPEPTPKLTDEKR